MMRLRQLLLHLLLDSLILLRAAEGDIVRCNETSYIDNHAVDEMGEYIFWEYSPGCTGEYYFYVDEYISTVTVYVDGGSNQVGKVYKNDVLVEPHGLAPDVSPDVHVTQYDAISILNGYGKYKLEIISDGTLNCAVYVRSLTSLGIDGGFVQDLSDDFVQYVVPQPNQGISRLPVVNKTSYFAFQYPISLKYPAKPQYVTVMLANGTKLESAVNDRYNCEASLISGPFQCSDDIQESYHLKITGIDRQGNMWERVYGFYCEINVVPTTPAPEPPPNECFNGGELVNFGQENQECYCNKNYEGKFCETQRCFNDGKPGRFGFCTCQAGYGGQFCEHVICEKQAEGYDDPNYRTIVFIVRRGRSMIHHIENIRQAAVMISSFYSVQHPTYIQRWVLITVFNGKIDTYDTANATEFQNAISLIENEEDTICNDAIFTAISTAIDHPAVQMYKRSLLFIFSDGMPNDCSNDRLRLMHQLSFFRGQMFFILADSPNHHCVIDTTTEEYGSLRSLAQFSFGQVVYLNLDELKATTFALANISYKADHVFSNDFMDSCKRAPKYQTFFVDRSLQNLYITATGKNLRLYLTNPAHERAEANLVYSASNRLYIWNLEELAYGSYLMELMSDSYEPCSLRVFGKGDTSLWMGVSSNINEDASVRQPIYKEASHMVARINNANYMEPENIIAEATIWTNEGSDDKRTVLYASGGIFRDNCNFNLYFGSWECSYPNKVFYANVYVQTEESGVIQRSYPLFCSTTAATEKPPGDCMNGGIQFTTSNGTAICICPAHYTGEKCQMLQCLNMGTSLGDRCECASGFSGHFCEKSSCYERNTRNSFSPNRRSLTFIIQDSITTRSAINSIKKQMPTLIQDLTHQQKDWISNYQLWRFNDSSFVPLSSSPNPNDFMDAISKLQYSNRQASDFSCGNLQVLNGLLHVLMNHELTLNGIVYLFINGYMKIHTGTSEVEAVYELLGRTRIMFNVVMLSGSPCGHDMNEIETTTLMNFVGYTGGQFVMVMPPKAGNVIRSIPTLYRTNYIYDSILDDCTATRNFYFPIDSQTQSFTAYLVGDFEENSVTYYMPNGYEKKPYNIWKDYGMGSQMDQIIQECDDGWELLNNRCWRFTVEKMNWMDAQQTCHENNAVLISLFNADEQEFVNSMAHNFEYWTGLNNRLRQNEYVWDALDDEVLKLESTGYSNFATGQPVQDSRKRCVYDKPGVGWSNDDCGAERNFICVKHAYDAEYEPEASNLEDLLARGIWKLSLKTSSGGCSVQIYGQSGIGLYTQYVTDLHMDYGAEQPYTYANDNRFIGHVTNQVTTSQGLSGSLQYAHLYKNSGKMNIIEAQTFFLRDSNKCAYEYISTPFKCPENNFLALVTGIDRFGYLYQRIQPVDCLNGPVAEDCENGVYNNGRCICDPNYKGDFCEIPICERGSLDEIMENCKCPEDYSGTFCEIPICKHGGTQDIPSVQNRTFVLLLDGSQNGRMENVAINLRSILEAVLHGAEKYNWFSHYTGLVFRDESMGIQSLSDNIEADEAAIFIDHITKEASKEYKPTVESRSTLAGLSRVLESLFIVPRSYIWVLTGGSTEHPEMLNEVLDSVAQTHSYVHFLMPDESPSTIKYNDSSLLAYYNLVVETSGQFYQIPKNSQSLISFWTALFDTYYDTYFVTTVSRQDCSDGLEEYVQVGSTATSMFIDYVGNGEVQLFQPNGIEILLKDDVVACSSDTNKVYRIQLQEQTPGMWKIRVKSFDSPTKFCRMEVRGHSAVEAFVGYVHDIGNNALHSNSVDYRPLANEPNSVVASTNSGQINFAQIFSADERKLLWSSPMIRRENCIYQYISAEHFLCTEPSLSVAIDGTDENGYAFRRMIHTHCVGNIKSTAVPLTTTALTTTPLPTPMIPTVTCDSNGKFDIVLMFDSSDGFKPNEFKTTVEEYFAIAENVILDSSHSRCAVGVYSSTAYFQCSLAEKDEFTDELDIVMRFGHDGVTGNNIYSVFSSLKDLEFRDDATKVLLLFSTVPLNKTEGSLPTYQDPVPLAQEFRNSGGKVIAFGYGKNADKVLLDAISGGCSKIAETFEALQLLIQWSTKAVCSNDAYCPFN